MLEILVLLATIYLIVGAFPKKGRGRRSMSGYVKGNLDEELALGALASITLVGVALDETMVEAGRISSLVAAWALGDWTAGAGDGPITFGVAHSDYSDAEIEEVIENTGSWDTGDKISREVAKRQVRIIGTFRSDTLATTRMVVFNEGRPMKTKLNWKMTTGDTLKIFAYNNGASALATGATIFANGHVNIFYD